MNTVNTPNGIFYIDVEDCFEHNYQRIDPSVVGLKDISTPFEELVKLGYKRFEYLDWDNYLAFPNDSNKN